MSTGPCIKAALDEVNIRHDLQLTVDSTALASLSTSVKGPQERPNKIDLAAIKEVFDNGEPGADR